MLKKLLHAGLALALTSGLALAAFNLGFDGKIIPQGTGTAPAVTSCGTSPSIIGTDTAGTVITGTATPTSCTVTFNVAYATAPHCSVTSKTAYATSTPSFAVSATAITITQAAVNSVPYVYICFAQPGG